MNTILVWILITSGPVPYSPPMTDLATCEHLQQSYREVRGGGTSSKCVQIKMAVTK